MVWNGISAYQLLLSASVWKDIQGFQHQSHLSDLHPSFRGRFGSLRRCPKLDFFHNWQSHRWHGSWRHYDWCGTIFVSSASILNFEKTFSIPVSVNLLTQKFIPLAGHYCLRPSTSQTTQVSRLLWRCFRGCFSDRPAGRRCIHNKRHMEMVLLSQPPLRRCGDGGNFLLA
jgi:hypothetical protein